MSASLVLAAVSVDIEMASPGSESFGVAVVGQKSHGRRDEAPHAHYPTSCTVPQMALIACKASEGQGNV